MAFYPGKTSLNCPGDNAVNRIPAELKLFPDSINSADFQPLENERFEQQRIPASGASPGNWQRLAAMLRAHNAGHIGFDNSGELAGIKMTPFTMTVIVNRTGFTTGRTG